MEPHFRKIGLCFNKLHGHGKLHIISGHIVNYTCILAIKHIYLCFSTMDTSKGT